MNKKFIFMKQFHLWLALVAFLSLGLQVFPAASQSNVALVQVQPAQVTNLNSVQLTLTGSGFAEGATVVVESIGPIPTTFVNPTQVTALLPAGTPPGIYSLSISNVDHNSAQLGGALTVMGPTSVQPSTVSNSVATELVITGVGFADGVVVVLENYGALATTFVSSNLIRSQLPEGVAAGVHTLRVVNPDGSGSALPNALTVTAPAATPEPTQTPAPTPFVRPVIVVHSYGASSTAITPGENLDFEITLSNSGQSAATNILATFAAGDFSPRATGGVQAVGTLAPGQASRFFQPLVASRDLSGKATAVLEVRVSYTDVNGTAYEESFALTFPVVRQSGGVAPTPTPTATPTVTPTTGPRLRPQLLISDYQTDVSQLEPGVEFVLELTVLNQGNADARGVTAILGGGSSSGGSVEGTPEPGGLNGAGGEFSNFAPVRSSNVQFLGDLAQGETLVAQQRLIVNATTKPGAYPVKVSFVYNDRQGGSFVDEQVITLLVYDQPSVELNFYVEPPPFFAGQPGTAPIQLVNTGKASTLFGNLSVTASGAQLGNNVVFVGNLEPGGFYPLDAMVIPEMLGPLELLVSVNYVDDFSRPQVITRTLTVDVMEAVDMGPIDGEPGFEEPEMPPAAPETLAQKLWRLIRGLMGLSSGPLQPEGPGGMEPFPEDYPGDGPGRGPDVGPLGESPTTPGITVHG